MQCHALLLKIVEQDLKNEQRNGEMIQINPCNLDSTFMAIMDM